MELAIMMEFIELPSMTDFKFVLSHQEVRLVD